jgi:mRNA interferase MazF
VSQSIERGDLFWANLDPTIGVEIQKRRPVLVVSNNAINRYSQLVIVLPITTNLNRFSPSHVLLPKGDGGLQQDSKVVTEQIRALDQQRLVSKIGTVSQQFLRLIEKAMLNSLDM